jgi:hypothetical protein
MHSKFDFLVCPYCKSDLFLKNNFLICKCWKRFPIENIYIFSGYDFKKKFNERRYGSGYKSDKLDYAHKIRLEKALVLFLNSGEK